MSILCFPVSCGSERWRLISEKMFATYHYNSFNETLKLSGVSCAACHVREDGVIGPTPPNTGQPVMSDALTKDDERNEWDKNVPPIHNIYLDRWGFSTPPEGFSGEPFMIRGLTKGDENERDKNVPHIRHRLWL